MPRLSVHTSCEQITEAFKPQTPCVYQQFSLLFMFKIPPFPFSFFFLFLLTTQYFLFCRDPITCHKWNRHTGFSSSPSAINTSAINRRETMKYIIIMIPCSSTDYSGCDLEMFLFLIIRKNNYFKQAVTVYAGTNKISISWRNMVACTPEFWQNWPMKSLVWQQGDLTTNLSRQIPKGKKMASGKQKNHHLSQVKQEQKKWSSPKPEVVRHPGSYVFSKWKISEVK